MKIVRQERLNVGVSLNCNRPAVPQMRERGLRAIAYLCKLDDDKADVVLLGGYEK